jgi:hypothetical protein
MEHSLKGAAYYFIILIRIQKYHGVLAGLPAVYQVWHCGWITLGESHLVKQFFFVLCNPYFPLVLQTILCFCMSFN